MKEEQHPTALRWVARLEAAIADACPDSPNQDLCDTRSYQVRDVRGRLTALGLGEPKSWQEAVTASAWRCHLDAAHEGTARVRLIWSQGWSVDRWEGPHAIRSCLVEELGRTAPQPDEALLLSLTLEGEAALQDG